MNVVTSVMVYINRFSENIAKNSVIFGEMGSLF